MVRSPLGGGDGSFPLRGRGWFVPPQGEGMVRCFRERDYFFMLLMLLPGYRGVGLVFGLYFFAWRLGLICLRLPFRRRLALVKALGFSSDIF